MVVSDTSSISNLYQIGEVDLLRKLFGEIVITPAVQRELYALDAQQEDIDTLKWIKVMTPSNQQMIENLRQDLDLGESESIALAIEKKAEYLIIDEFRGRQIAEEYGVKIVGVLGLLIQAKQKGMIPSVKVEVEKLLAVGFRLNEKLVLSVLKRLGEM